jgi:hypothetical protein
MAEADAHPMAQQTDFQRLSHGPASRVAWPGRTSDALTAANRQNAQRSTGPRTPAGKAKAARNALRHGLSRPVLADPVLAREVEARASAIAGKAASPAHHELAMAIAEAEVDLARIARVRADLTARRAAGCDVEKQLLALERYARRARFRHEIAREAFAAAPSLASGERLLAEQTQAERSRAERTQPAERT